MFRVFTYSVDSPYSLKDVTSLIWQNSSFLLDLNLIHLLLLIVCIYWPMYIYTLYFHLFLNAVPLWIHLSLLCSVLLSSTIDRFLSQSSTLYPKVCWVFFFQVSFFVLFVLWVSVSYWFLSFSLICNHLFLKRRFIDIYLWSHVAWNTRYIFRSSNAFLSTGLYC